MKSGRFLVLRGGAIGDFILTFPALRALRDRWPDGHIELVGYPHIAGLALAAGLADKVVSLDKAEVAEYFSLSPSISIAQQAYICSFDVVLSYLYDPSGVVKTNLLGVGARQVIYESPRVQSGHAVDQLMKPLGELAIFGSGLETPELKLNAEELGKGQARAKGFGESVVAIHPGSGNPKKNWPLEKYAALARVIAAETDWKPVFTVGEADDPIAQALPGLLPAVSVVRELGLVELAGLLAACRGYVGNDSGITQLAAALGIPAVCLFGPTDPSAWAPRGPNVRVIASPRRSAESLAAIGVEAVFESLLDLASAPSASGPRVK